MTVQLDPRRARDWPQVRWDHGIRWFTRLIAPATTSPIDPYYLQEQVLRVADLSAEYDYVTAILSAATSAAEDATQRALEPQTWDQVLSGFPSSGRIVLERPPLIEIVSVSYYDADGSVQQLDVSPAEFDTVPSGAFVKAELRPLSGASWPATSSREDAVTVRFQAGYESGSTDATYALVKAGIALMAGELYKQRTLSVHAVHNTPAVLDLKRFWRPVF